MSTVKDYKKFIQAQNKKNCPSITGKKKAELKKLAVELGYIEPAKKAPVKKAPAKKAPAKKAPAKKQLVRLTKWAFEPKRDLKHTHGVYDGKTLYYFDSGYEAQFGMTDFITRIDGDVHKNKSYKQNRQTAYNKVYKDYKSIQMEYEKNCRDEFTNKRSEKICNDLFKHLNPKMFTFAEALEFWKKDPLKLKKLKDTYKTTYNKFKNLPELPKNIPPYKGKIPPYDGDRYANLVGHKDKKSALETFRLV